MPPHRPRCLAAAVVALLLATLSGCGAGEPRSAAPSAAAEREALARSPAPLAALHRQAGQLLDGGPAAFKARLAILRGHPIVVNKWASWCGPCKAEFPFFQRESVERGRRVAFLGVDSGDNDGDARSFLARLPVSYPSYKDPRLKIAALFNAVAAFPSTAFYDSRGRAAYLHQGAYLTRAQLAKDIERYAR
jgi:cytochrome c biogenesis protein CcmG, thiol:disulfide interchange protein DsbE